MIRKVILALVLVSMMGLPCGRLTEDLCALGGIFADDPSTPIGVTELALPSHQQTAQKAVAPMVSVQRAPDISLEMSASHPAPETLSAPAPASPNPIRC